MSNVGLEQVSELIGGVVDLTGVSLTEQTVIGQDFALDSQDMLRVLSQIEAHYGFRFSVQDLVSLKTIGDVLRAIERNVAEGQPDA